MADLRIVAIFMVFISSALGCSAAYFVKGKTMLMIKMFSAGVILSLALVHIIFESIMDLSEVVEYPLGGVCALVGLVGMMVIEHMSHSWTSEGPASTPQQSQQPQPPQHHIQLQAVHHIVEGRIVTSPSFPVTSLAPTGLEPAKFPNIFPTHLDHAINGQGHTHPPGSTDHSHTCITNLNSSNWVANATSRNKSTMMVFLFEVACLFHSVFIGIALGVSTDQDEVRGLMVAILFHQALEGMSLGSVISETNFSKCKSFLMFLAYSTTTSVGIAIGMGLENSYSDEDNMRVLIAGIFLGISGGMLLYVSLFQIIAEEFSKDLHQHGGWQTKAGMYASLLMGAAAMCVLAIWM